MSIGNLWASLKRVDTEAPLLVATVIALNADGTSTVQFPDGSQTRVQGQGVAVNDKAFIQAGRIEGEAPNLAVVNVQV